MAKTNINTQITEAEKRVKAKLRRLEKRGIKTRAISPLKPVANMSLKEKHAYKSNLEIFIFGNQYVAGKEGAPISRVAYSQMQRAVKEANQFRMDKFGNVYGNDKVLGHPNMTVKELTHMYETYNPKTGQYETRQGNKAMAFQMKKVPDPSVFRSQKSVYDYISSVNKIITPEYNEKKLRILKENIRTALDYLGFMDSVDSVVDRLTPQQIDYLIGHSTFISTIFDYPKDENATDIEADKRHSAIELYQPETEANIIDIITDLLAL